MLISLVVAMTGGILSAGFLQPASATLAGSPFNGADGTLDAGVMDITDPVQGADTTNFSNGSDEDTICPGIATGTAPDSDDLDHFYFKTASNASGVFLYLAWHRIKETGTKTIDFELNQSSLLAPGCGNGYTPARTAGDELISFDFSGGGGTVTLNRRTWVGTSVAGVWSAPTMLVTGEEGSVDALGKFGEMVINGVVSGLFTPGACTDFASAYAKSHASNSFPSQLKDFTAGVSQNISNCGSVVITKTDDAVPAQPVNGAVFGLFTDVAGVIGTAIAGKTCTIVAGTCTISDIAPPGTYWVRETTTPAGYVTAADQQVTIGTAAVPLTFVDNRKPGSIKVNKTDDATPAQPLNGATFSLYTDVAGAIGTAVAGKTCTTAGAGTCTISGILPPGNYWLRETTTPTGYTTAADQGPIAVALDTLTTAPTIVDNRKPATINITKVDDAVPANAVNGAVFGLFTDVAGAIGTAVAGKTCTTAGTGICSITNILPPGTYWVRETTTPAGYVTAADQQVTVALDATIPLTFVNNQKPGSIKVNKTDDATPAQPLNGATFSLYTDVAGAIGTAVAGKTCTTAGAGTCTISGILPPGNYWLRETTTPAGYTTAADQGPIAVALDTLTTAPTIVDVRKPARIDITKVDDAVPANAVNGAVFGLFTDVAGVIGTAVAGKTCTTAGTGICSITNILPPGTYWVKETSTPAGYDTAPSQKVTVALDATIPLTFVDVRQPVSVGLVKTVNGMHPTAAAPLVVEAGSTLNYLVTITNTGVQTLTISQLTDTLKASLPATCTQGIGSSLASGASFTCSYTAVADKAANNVATAGGTDVLGRTVTATDQTFVAPIHPAVSITKTGPSFGHVGDVVAYQLTIVNSGDVGLTSVVASDPKCSAAPTLVSKTGGNQDAVLELGETWTYTCNHTVTAADGNTFVNNATVGALDPLALAVSGTAAHTLTVLHPGLSVVKTANPISGSVGDVITYTYVVTNTGDTDLTNVTVDDDILGAISTIPSLAKGASTTVTKTMTLTSTSPTVNVATAKGTDPSGFQVSSTDDATISIVLGEVLVNAPELPRTGAPITDEVRLALLLIGLGALVLLFPARRRRRQQS